MNVARAEDRAPWRHDPSADPGAKTEGGQHDAALSFPFGIGTKAANRPDLFWCSLYLISRPRFLHFTLNQHSTESPQLCCLFVRLRPQGLSHLSAATESSDNLPAGFVAVDR